MFAGLKLLLRCMCDRQHITFERVCKLGEAPVVKTPKGGMVDGALTWSVAVMKAAKRGSFPIT